MKDKLFKFLFGTFLIAAVMNVGFGVPVAFAIFVGGFTSFAVIVTNRRR